MPAGKQLPESILFTFTHDLQTVSAWRRTDSGAASLAESARRKSMMLCQRFERRMRQCGAFELRISTKVARPNHLQSMETAEIEFRALQFAPSLSLFIS